MTRHSRSLLLVCALCLFFTAAGCATTLLYNHADWLIARQLDGYFDLSRSQKTFVYARLDGILDRHRHEALPRYEAVVRQVIERVRQGLTDQDLEWAFTQYDLLKADLFARFATDGAEFVRLVREPQVSRLKQALHTRLKREEALLHDSPQARLEKRTERVLSLAKEWLGTTTRQQEQEITRLVMNFPDTLPGWYAHQRERDDRLVALIESSRSSETAARLYEWLVEQDKGADPQFVRTSGALRLHIARLILALDRLTTPEQRQYLIAKLDDLSRTMHRLSET